MVSFRIYLEYVTIGWNHSEGMGMTMDQHRRITIKALKHGGRPHYEWESRLLEQTEQHVVVLSEYGRPLRHHSKGRIFTIESWTIECFPSGLWFTVSADVIDGKISQYYCNVCKPSEVHGNQVSFTDLDIDYIYRDGVWRVVDEDEFAAHTIKYGYPPELVKQVREELRALQERVDDKRYPFDGTLERFVDAVPGVNGE